MHTFPDHRPDPFNVVLTVIAQSEAGEIRGSNSFHVTVNEVEGFVVAGWDAGGTFKSAVRALSVVGRVLLTIVIWVGIFSPVWLAVIAAIVFLPRLQRRFGWGLGGARSESISSGQWQPGRSDAVPARPVGTGAEPVVAHDPAPEGEHSLADEDEQGVLVCANCGVVFPATNDNGQPARFCPSCGVEAPLPDGEDRPPNA